MSEKQKAKRTFVNTQGDTMWFFQGAPENAYPPPSFINPPSPMNNPYQDRFSNVDVYNEAEGPPNYQSPFAPPYPQPQRPSAYSDVNAGGDGRQFSPEMLGDQPIPQPGPYASGYQFDPMDPQGDFSKWKQPRPDPSTAAPFNAAWRRNVQDSAKDFGSNMGGMFKDAGGWFKNKWNRAAEIAADPDRNLTGELYSKGRDAIVGGAKNIASEATDVNNMRPWAQKAYMSSQLGRPEELKLRTSPGQIGGDAGPSMPPLEEQGFEPGSEPALRRLQAMGMGSDVTPIEALGAKMWQGGRAAGRGIGEVGRAATDMAGDAIGGATKGIAQGGGRLVGGFAKNFKEGFQKGYGVTGPKKAPQASKNIGPGIKGIGEVKQKSGFKGAFAAARKSGKKEFTYKGKRYNTKLKSEAKKTTVAKAKPKKKKDSSVGKTYANYGRFGY